MTLTYPRLLGFTLIWWTPASQLERPPLCTEDVMVGVEEFDMVGLTILKRRDARRVMFVLCRLDCQTMLKRACGLWIVTRGLTCDAD